MRTASGRPVRPSGRHRGGAGLPGRAAADIEPARTAAADEVEELRARLATAEETLQAIVSGEVDAVVVDRRTGPQVYTLKSATEPYRLLVEQMAQGALTVTGDGIILYCNESFARMIGRPRERLAGMHLYDFVAGNSAAAIGGLLGGRNGTDGEITLRSRTGGTVETLISAAPLAADGENIYCLAVTDLSDQELRRRHAAVVQASEAAIYALDPELKIRTWNRGAELQLGLPAAKTIGRDERDFWPDEARAELNWLVQHCNGTGAAATSELRRQRADGTVADLIYTLTPLRDRRGVLTGYSVVAHDITERKASEQRLRESEARFRIMADNLPHIIWVHDEEGRQQFVNQTFCDYFGIHRAEISPRRWQMLVHPEDREGYVAAFHEAVRERRPFHHEVRIRRADGEWRWFESWGRPRFDDAGRFLGHVGTSADITERKRTEEHRQLLVNELNHRVKNTLAIVQGIALQSFKDRCENGAESLKAFERRLAALAAAHNLLTRSNWESATLHDLTRETVKAACTADAPVRIEGPPVALQPKQATTFVMAMHELCTNAVKYGALSSASGQVDISWKIAENGAEKCFKLVWRERGGPAVKPPRRRGFGSRMIEQALASELNGTVSMDFRPEGLVCTIRGRLGEEG